MLYAKLVKYCLQYLEQSSDYDVMNTDISDLNEDDTFVEYIYNIEHSIYMAMTRYAQSLVLPVVEAEIPTGTSVYYLTTDNTSTGKRLFHKIKEIYAMDDDNNIYTDITYYVINSKIILKNMDENLTYYIIYHPTILTLDNYTSDTVSIYDLELTNLDGNGLSIPDEMAINIKYMVYSEMKVEDNPTVANINKNYFESYLEECKEKDVQNNLNEVKSVEMGDIYGD